MEMRSRDTWNIDIVPWKANDSHPDGDGAAHPIGVEQVEALDEWLGFIMKAEYKRVETKHREKPQIQAVCRMEAEKHKNYIEPQVLCLGLCHRGNPKLQAMERQKRIATKLFVRKNSLADIRSCYDEVAAVIGEARDAYVAELTNSMSERAFARIMFLDGCFAAYFIEGSNKGRIDLEINSRLFPLIVRDMFLLENQLPYAVLHALLRLRFNSSQKATDQMLQFIGRQTTLTNFRYSNGLPRWLPGFWRGQGYSGVFGVKPPLHLLDILRRMLLISSPPPVWASSEIDQTQGSWQPASDDYAPVHQFGSVMELKDAGIRFGASHSGHLTSVRFESNAFFPKILLPPMVINEATISQMLNLIALEMCFESPSEGGVTSFLCFMDSLINHAADVKELRAKGVLHHGLGSDEDVAKLFNELPLAGDLNVYRNVKRRVMSHRKSRARVSVARCLNTHFGSPWSAISFVAAGLLLILTAVQTYFTVFPRKN